MLADATVQSPALQASMKDMTKASQAVAPLVVDTYAQLLQARHLHHLQYLLVCIFPVVKL